MVFVFLGSAVVKILSDSASVVVFFFFFCVLKKGFYVGRKLRVSGTGRGKYGGSVRVGVDIDLDLVVVSIISAYFYHHYNN